MSEQMTGVEMIAAERKRVIESEGYTPAHDAQHDPEDLAAAAVAYALRAEDRQIEYGAPIHWPWTPDYWKPTPGDRVRELVKAGQLIAAAIDAEVSRG